jgi:glycosyltransferase involved in cell wall biosynthesis
LSLPLHILLPSDVFPPRAGGAGWSAHALALALIGRGHHVTAVVPRQGAPGLSREDVLGVPTVRWGYYAPRIPFVQNYFRHERLWPRLAEVLVQQATADNHADSSFVVRRSSIIHAQHVQVTPAAVIAGQRLGAPVVVTVRDHWPWDYFATGLHGDRVPFARQTWATLATDLPARLGSLRGAAALLAIPYMLMHLRRRQRYLAQADAVIAVSAYIARRLQGIVLPERLHVIPNMLDMAAIDATTAASPASVAPGTPYLLFVGKLERNKGAHLLVDIFREFVRLTTTDDRRPANDGQHSRIKQHTSFSILHSQFSIPELLIAGSGPLRAYLERELASLGVRTCFLDWADHDETLRLMAHCQALLFPSAWGEPLSRVLLEAMACGAPIVAMPMGGTPEALAGGTVGTLEATPESFARRLAELLARPAERAALGAAARRAARERYASAVVVGQVEGLYRSLLGR